jgi:energy-coupling factor transporter ATP-binding protein EcfA2
VALCAALAANPRLLLADEVTGELDDDAGTRVLAALRQLAADEGTTVILVTHDPKATRIADRTVTVRDGRVTAELRRGATDRRVVMIDDGGVLRIVPDDLAAAGLEGEAGLGVTDGAVVLRRLGERPTRTAVARRGAQPARIAPAPAPVAACAMSSGASSRAGARRWTASRSTCSKAGCTSCPGRPGAARPRSST